MQNGEITQLFDSLLKAANIMYRAYGMDCDKSRIEKLTEWSHNACGQHVIIIKTKGNKMYDLRIQIAVNKNRKLKWKMPLIFTFIVIRHLVWYAEDRPF